MHAIIASPYPRQTHAFLNSMKRQNINTICVSPKNLCRGWEPRTDAVIFLQPLAFSTWLELRGFISSLNKRTPIILIGKIHQSVFREASFQQYIKRTVVIDDRLSLEEIPILIKECIGRGCGEKNNVYAGEGDCVLDKKNRQIICQGTVKQLTKKEFFLLELLISNMGQITTREEIIEYVWDKGKFISQNTIEVYISRLRKKIDKESKNSLISTIPCLGYQFAKM